MSDEARLAPEFVDAFDVEAPTERDPRVHAPASEHASGMPPRGVALSVLWWLEGDADNDARR